MSTFEEVTMAQKRDQMYKTNIVKLIEIKKDIQQRHSTKRYPYLFNKNKNADKLLKYRLMRDLYSYTIVNFIVIQYNAIVFGGFVTAHISGKEWNDLDIMLCYDDLKTTIESFMEEIIAFLQLIYGFNEINLTTLPTNRNTPYGHGKYQICIDEENMKYQIKMDISLSNEGKGPITGMVPVTLGKCLMMNKNGIEMVQVPELINLDEKWTVQKIIDIVRTGKDVGLSYADISNAAKLKKISELQKEV